MKKISTILLLTTTILFLSCQQSIEKQEALSLKSSTTAAEVVQPSCVFTLGDQTKQPDLTVTAYLGNDKSRFSLYGINPNNPSVAENGIVSSYAALAYNWIYQDTFSAIKTWCIFENIAPCGEDFWFTESQGTTVLDALGRPYVSYGDRILKTNVFYNGELVTTQNKALFEPSEDPDTTTGCEPFDYGTFNVIHSHNADLYINPNKIPRNTNGLFVIRLEVNPLINGCHAIRESNYDNNKFFAPVNKNGLTVSYDQTAMQANIPAAVTNLSFTPHLQGNPKTITLNWSSKAERFTVYKNGQSIAQNIYKTTYTDTLTNGNVNNLVYSVVAENEGIGTSPPQSITIHR